MLVKLSNTKPHNKYKIIKVDANRRLFEYGFFTDAQLTVLKFSPMAGSLLVYINDSMVSIRIDLANLIEVEIL